MWKASGRLAERANNPYNVVGSLAPLPAEHLFEFRGGLCGFVGIRAGHYASHARQISPRWDTLAIASSHFRQLAQPVETFFEPPSPQAGARHTPGFAGQPRTLLNGQPPCTPFDDLQFA